ncbi:MAG: L,D-transpeptidase family protein [Methylophilus sp.]|nr:L,D-transpeptidase family protein [Methylophilus sp.]
MASPFPDEQAGTIIVDPDAGYLHLVQPRKTARRYGAGTGAAAHAWNGAARLQFARAWPRWKVPDEMIARRPKREACSVANGGMDPGPGMRLAQGRLICFRMARTRFAASTVPASRTVWANRSRPAASGCIRLLDQDAIDLYRRAPHGAKVGVLPSILPTGLAVPY